MVQPTGVVADMLHRVLLYKVHRAMTLLVREVVCTVRMSFVLRVREEANA